MRLTTFSRPARDAPADDRQERFDRRNGRQGNARERHIETRMDRAVFHEQHVGPFAVVGQPAGDAECEFEVVVIRLHHHVDEEAVIGEDEQAAAQRSLTGRSQQALIGKRDLELADPEIEVAVG